MQELISDGLWSKVERLFKKSRRRSAAIAYVTSSRLDFRNGDILVCDASDNAIASGQTDCNLLAAAVKQRAKLYSCPGLHAKILVMDGVAVIGSANLSSSSEKKLVEAALVTDDPNIAATAKGFIEDLAERSDPIEERFLRRIATMKVVRAGWLTSQRSPGMVAKPPRSRTWLAGVQELAEGASPREAMDLEAGIEASGELTEKASSDVGWIRYARNNRQASRVRDNDTLVMIWRPIGRKTPKKVYRASRVLMVRKEKNCTRIFYEIYRNSERTALNWSEFHRHIKLAGARRAGPNTFRLLDRKEADIIKSLWG